VSTCRVLRTAKVLACIVCVAGLAGCAVVKTTNADGTQDISIQPLRMEANSQSTDGPRLVSASVLGISSTARGLDIGLVSEEVVLAPAKCQAVFVVRSEAQAIAASSLAKSIEKGCVVQQ
jgi:hypothetical protein